MITRRTVRCITQVILVWAMVAGVWGCGSAATDQTIASIEWHQQCIIEDKRLDELSGLSESMRYPGYFWANNDSGDSLRAFLLAPTGKTVAVVNLSGAGNTDTESLHVAGTKEKSWVYIGDTGDNRARRPQIEIDRFEEPEIDLTQFDQDITVPCEQMVLTYGDGKATDAETMLVDAQGYIGIVTKSLLGSKLWLTPQPFSTKPQTLDLATEIPVAEWRQNDENFSALFTDGAISFDESRVALMTYSHYFVWDTAGSGLRGLAKVLSQAPDRQGVLPPLAQPEAMTFVGDDLKLAVSSEGKNPPLMVTGSGFQGRIRNSN